MAKESVREEAFDDEGFERDVTYIRETTTPQVRTLIEAGERVGSKGLESLGNLYYLMAVGIDARLFVAARVAAGDMQGFTVKDKTAEQGIELGNRIRSIIYEWAQSSLEKQRGE